MFHVTRSVLRGPAPTPRPERQFGLLATISLALGHNGNLAAGRLLAPLVAIDMAAGEALAGVFTGLFTVVPIFTTVWLGRWIDRVGTLWPVRLTIAFNLAAALGMVLFPGLPALVAAALVTGAATMGAHIAVSRAIGEGDADRRRRNFSRLAMGYSFVQFATPTLAGIAYDLAGPRGAFGVMLALALSSIAILGSGRHLLSHDSRSTAPAGAARPRLTDLFRVPGVTRGVFLHGMFCGALVFFALAAALHGKAIGYSASQIGALYGFMSAGAFLSRLLGPPLARRLSERVLLTGALALGAAVWLGVPFVANWTVFAAASLALGLVLGLGMPMTQAQIYGAAPAARVTEAMGVSMAVANGFQLVTPLVLGLVAAAWGIGPMIWGFSAALAATAVVAAAGGRPGRT